MISFPFLFATYNNLEYKSDLHLTLLHFPLSIWSTIIFGKIHLFYIAISPLFLFPKMTMLYMCLSLSFSLFA